MAKDKVIGIIGGMGPHASLDLANKIIELTPARTDHDHLPVALLNYPDRIVDRSTFLFGESDTNPAGAIADIARDLEQVGAVVAGMPCNTAHAPPIYDVVVEQLRDSGHGIRLIHMIEETACFLRDAHDDITCVGTLSTLAVYELGLYRRALQEAGLETVFPDEHIVHDVVNPTIFDPDFGLKAKSHPVTDRARQSLLDAIDHLRNKGADAVILGCTELPIAVPEKEVHGVQMIDPTEVLARALIEATYPETLAQPAAAEDSQVPSP